MKKLLLLLSLSMILPINAMWNTNYQPTFSDKLQVVQVKLDNGNLSFSDVKELLNGPVEYTKLLTFLISNWSAIMKNAQRMIPGMTHQEAPEAKNTSAGLQVPSWLKNILGGSEASNKEVTQESSHKVPDWMNIFGGSEAPKQETNKESGFQIPDFLKNILNKS